MNAQEIKVLVAKGESESLELKTFVPPPNIIAQHTASLANTAGGILLLGIREPQDIVGVDDKRARASIEAAQRLLSPGANVTYELVPVEGRTVAVVQVPKAVGIVAAGGGYFRREGDKIRPLTADEIRGHLVPSQSPDEDISKLARAVEQATQTIAEQTQAMEKLSEDFRRANSPWKKLGLAGLGALGTVFFRWVLAWLNLWPF